jgi:hypothetical protein
MNDSSEEELAFEGCLPFLEAGQLNERFSHCEALPI